MPPKPSSRHTFTLGLSEGGARFLSEREPYSFRALTDARRHLVMQGDTLWSLAGHYFAPLPRACGLWWVIADFQPDPIIDPTLTLEPGRLLYIPSTRALTDVILSERRRRS